MYLVRLDDGKARCCILLEDKGVKRVSLSVNDRSCLLASGFRVRERSVNDISVSVAWTVSSEVTWSTTVATNGPSVGCLDCEVDDPPSKVATKSFGSWRLIIRRLIITTAILLKRYCECSSDNCQERSAYMFAKVMLMPFKTNYHTKAHR